jgi:hypothetical protein
MSATKTDKTKFATWQKDLQWRRSFCFKPMVGSQLSVLINLGRRDRFATWQISIAKKKIDSSKLSFLLICHVANRSDGYIAKALDDCVV